jgi:tetratricopeptide (TPR) repeat protein
VNPLTPPKEQLEAVISLYSSGKIQETIDTVNNLTKSYPDTPLLFNILGACYKKLGQIDTAAKMFSTAVTINPGYAEAHFNHAIILNETGKTDISVESYKKAIAILPNYSDAHNNLGNIYLDRNQYKDALKHYEFAILYKSDFFEAHNNLGVTNRELEQVSKAVQNFKKAIEINPKFTKAYLNLGNALKDLGQGTEAKRCFEQVLTYEVNNAQAHVSLGTFFKENGQAKDAIECFKKAISIQPNYGIAYFNLVMMQENKIEEELIYKMLSKLSTSELSQTDRINFCFALANTYEKLGKKDDFFKFLNEGNRLRKNDLNYSLERSLATIELVKKMFLSTPSSNKPSISYKTSNIQPIFVLGMPRSGSTLVEQILSSHNNVHGAGEIQYFRKIITPVIEKYIENETQSSGEKKKNISISDEDYLSIHKEYLNLLSRFNVPENFIVDKSLLNYRFIGIILNTFPEAKIIHLKRDARAICWSIYKNNFPQSGMGFGNNMEDLASYYSSYNEMMTFWHEKFPNKIYDLNYENLTTNQEKETRKLLKYCELEWDDNCLKFHKNKRAVKTASSLQVRKKIYKNSSDAWKKYESNLGPLLTSLSSF